MSDFLYVSDLSYAMLEARGRTYVFHKYAHTNHAIYVLSYVYLPVVSYTIRVMCRMRCCRQAGRTYVFHTQITQYKPNASPTCPHTTTCVLILLHARRSCCLHWMSWVSTPPYTPYIAHCIRGLTCAQRQRQQEGAADAENAAREMIDSPSGGKAAACWLN
jgi:hypothetical protein